jgi:hypothetical protein
MEPETPPKRPGEALALVLLEMPMADRLPFLAHLEQKYRNLGDLEMLREIRAYRAANNL